MHVKNFVVVFGIFIDFKGARATSADHQCCQHFVSTVAGNYLCERTSSMVGKHSFAVSASVCGSMWSAVADKDLSQVHFNGT